jgi:hypothetical protein
MNQAFSPILSNGHQSNASLSNNDHTGPGGRNFIKGGLIGGTAGGVDTFEHAFRNVTE